LTMKSLGDAIGLRNRLIDHLEQADVECCGTERGPLCTFVVAGGGFAGVETIAAMNDFLREACEFYPSLDGKRLRVVLVHDGPFLLPELGRPSGPTRRRSWPSEGSRSGSGRGSPACLEPAWR